MNDVIIIGAGPGGYETAILAAEKGLKTKLIEKRELGGTFLNRGCIPTKTLLHASEFLNTEEYAKLGLSGNRPQLDLKQLQAYKNEVIEKLRSGIELQLKKAKVELIHGNAQIVGAHQVAVNGEILEAEHIILASGSRPSMPSFLPRLKNVMTSDELLEYDQPIRHLVIIGGGVIGMEFASVYHAMGSKVSVIEAQDQLLPAMDKEIALKLKMLMNKRGIDIHTAAKVAGIEPGLKITYFEKECEHTIECDAILAAVGRQPNVDSLWTNVNLEVKNGRLTVNEYYQTSAPSVYAIGDVNKEMMLAHAAVAQGKKVLEHILHETPKVDLTLVPSCVYTNPEIASVGLTLEMAKSRGISVIAMKALMSANGKSVLSQQESGFVKLIVDEESGRLLGAHLFCERASDMISELTLAISAGLTVDQLASVIHPHPTFSEAIASAAMQKKRK